MRVGSKISVILKCCRNKTNTPKAARASAIQTDTGRREIRTSGKILQGAINQIQKRNPSSASEAAGEAENEAEPLPLPTASTQRHPERFLEQQKVSN